MPNAYDLLNSSALRAAQDLQGFNELVGKSELSTIAKGLENATRLQRSVDFSFLRTEMEGFSHAQALARTLALDFEKMWTVSEAMRQALSFNERFTLPLQTHLDQITAAFPKLDSIKLLGLDTARLTEIGTSFAGIRTAWVNSENVLESIRGVSELHTLAAGLADLKPFSSALTDVLRLNLGDWRNVVSLPNSILTDPVERFDFYRDLGFNDALTNFPASAFDELVDHSGLRFHVLSEPARKYRDGLDFEPDEAVDDVPGANRKAYDIIFRLESSLRQFMDEQMTKVFGEDWIRHQTPSGMYQEWVAKKEKAERSGQPAYPLIAYADFSHYQPIIERGVNWEKVFKFFFGRKGDIQESLVRLGPVRICAMHCRIITQDDELILMSETRRILKAMGFSS